MFTKDSLGQEQIFRLQTRHIREQGVSGVEADGASTKRPERF
jgi:hypothetical protein